MSAPNCLHRPLLLTLALLGSGFGPLAAQGRPALLETVDRYSNRPTLGQAVAVSQLVIPLGRMTFTLASGACAPLTSSDGKVVGLHFRGKGAFRYRSEDPLERAALGSNHQRNLGTFGSKARLTDEKGIALLTEDFNSLTLWWAGKGPALPQGAAAPLPAKAFEEDFAYFRRDGLGDRGQAFGIHLGNTPNATLAWAEIQGEDAPFIYRLDEGGPLRESLWSVAKPLQPAIYNGLRRVLLSEQPIGWTWKNPLPPLMNLVDVDIDLQANLGQASLKVKETLIPGDNGIKVVALDLYTEVIPAYKQGLYTVSRVTDESGRALPFHHRDNTLLVELAQASPAGQPFKLTFEYGGPILLRPGGDSYWELGVEPWFPQPELAGQGYTVHARFRTHKNDLPVSGGRTLRRERTPEGNLLEVALDKPVQFFTVMAGAYDFTEEVKDGLTIRVAAYGEGGAGMQNRLINIARQTIAFYEQIFEKFPFEELNIVQVNDVGFGQAPPGMLKITNEAFNAKIDSFSAFFTKGINQRFAHEIAHQYWGHLVKMPSYEEQWITESFANYASALAMRSMKNQGASAYEGMLSGWRNQASAYAPTGTIPFANRLNWIEDPRHTFLARTSLLYEKGALILAALHKDMGDKAFALFMKSALANFRWKPVTTATLEQLAGMAGRKDYSALFRDCYWGTQMPK